VKLNSGLTSPTAAVVIWDGSWFGCRRRGWRQRRCCLVFSLELGTVRPGMILHFAIDAKKLSVSAILLNVTPFVATSAGDILKFTFKWIYFSILFIKISNPVILLIASKNRSTDDVVSINAVARSEACDIPPTSRLIIFACDRFRRWIKANLSIAYWSNYSLFEFQRLASIFCIATVKEVLW